MLGVPEWLVFFVKQLLRSKISLAFVTLLTVAITFSSALAPLYIGRLIDEATRHSSAGLVELSLLLLGALLLSEILSAIRNYTSAKAMLRLTYDLILESLASILRTSAGFFARTPRGELLQRCVQDTRTIQQFGLFSLPQFVQELLLACIGMVVVARIYWPVAVMIAASYVVLFIPVYVLGHKREHSRRRLVRHNALLRHSLLEKLESIKQIRIFGTENREYETFRSEQKEWAKLTYDDEIVTHTYKGFPRIPDAMAPALVFLFVGWQVMEGKATIGELMTIIAFVPALNAPVRSFFTLYVTLTDIRLRIQGILEYLRLPAESGHDKGLRQPPDCRRLPISFHNVSVAGERGFRLKNVSFTIRPGEHVAIVGPSGAGKSTLLQLLVRLQEPAEGEVFIGAEPLRELDANGLRGKIGYVTQEAVLFNDTLHNNLTLFKQADRETLDRLLSAFGAEQIVSALPDGYRTMIGDKGAVLSGGRRQLIALVRTIVKQPDLLLLDEATASLDRSSENQVLAGLRSHCADLTRICVTHRLQGAVNADRIIVLDQGVIVQQGTHEELIRDGDGLYARLWTCSRDAESGQEGRRHEISVG